MTPSEVLTTILSTAALGVSFYALTQTQKSQRAEARHDAARDLWVAAFWLTAMLDTCRGRHPIDCPLDELIEAEHALVRAWALAEVSLRDEGLLDEIDRMNALAMGVAGTIVRSKSKAGAPPPIDDELWKRISAVRMALKDQLRKYIDFVDVPTHLTP